jgi:hypothetical protein
VWKFEAPVERAYRLTVISSDRATVLEAHAFKLQGQLFLDLLTKDEDFRAIPPHYLMKVAQTGSTLRLSVLDNEWLIGLLKQTPTAIAHQLVGEGSDRRVVLTADTPALQAFVRNHLATPKAWHELTLRRVTAAPDAVVEAPRPSEPAAH